ncbi:MAG: hypothetical protein SGI96_21155 [Bacteroidota bacterium]|nr:hypothetical protein [Bacteroidota bacterium]
MIIKITGQGTISETEKRLTVGVARYKKALSLEMWRSLTLIEAAIIQEIRKNFNTRTGGLLNAVESTVVETKNEVIGLINVNKVYAAIHEFGGIITPKRAQYLRFPVASNMKPDGSPIVTDSGISQKVMLPLRKGDGWLILDGARNAPMFLLKKSVTIPKRPYVAPAFEKTRDRVFEKFGFIIQSEFLK